MKILDFSKFKNPAPAHAEGRVRLDLTDPLTGRVKERIEGKNHVFADAIGAASWRSHISGMFLCMNDNGDAVDPDMPFLKGDTIGYGVPSTGSSGTFRGAYNSANQILGQASLTSVLWKFQYDFTSAQANIGTIRNIGLTKQYKNLSPGAFPTMMADYAPTVTPVSAKYLTSDGRYRYEISTAGIITKYDDWLGTSTKIDVSASVGTVSGDLKTVGFNPNTKKYYVWVYSSTAANRKMHVFSDATFATKETTYTASNLTFGTTANWPLYIYGEKAYWLGNRATGNFVTNVLGTTLAWPTTRNNCMATEGIANVNPDAAYYRAMPLSTKYVMLGGLSTVTTGKVYVLDLSTETFVVQRADMTDYSSQPYLYPMSNYPFAEKTLPGIWWGNEFRQESALTTYVLPTPVTKTSANGLTATYELEVYW